MVPLKRIGPWKRVLWGILMKGSIPNDPPMLLGDAWYKPMPQPGYPGEPTRALLFYTRSEARAWCKDARARYSDRNDCCGKWRFRPIRVTESVRPIDSGYRREG